MLQIIAEFIPIVLIFILLSSFRKLVDFSHTILGKLIAVFIIIFYTCVDKILGIFVCAIIIFYYQTDIVENMLNMDIETIDTNDDNNNNNNVEMDDFVDDYMYLSNDDNKKKEKMTNYSSVYEDKPMLLKNENLENDFRKNQCVNGELKNKGIKVNYEMAEHVFPEIKFRRGVCNPCSNSCDFSIIESKINTEQSLREM
jgi:hypothetical protein